MNKKFTIAIIGCGGFSRGFMPAFKLHPFTKKVYVCDLVPEKAEKASKDFGLEIIPSFEDALKNKEIDAIANFTERHLHGQIVIKALKAGKHVYSAVPMAPTIEECQEIVELVKQTGLTYMIGETCYYYPCAMFCREAYKEGKFGEFAYASSQYYHNIDAISYGARFEERGMAPMLYPTHSTAMVLSAVNSYVKKVVCFGQKAPAEDKAFDINGPWKNEFINQYSLMQLANGGTARVTEARGFGWNKPSSYISSFYGSKGGYEFSNAQHILVEKIGEFTVKTEKVKLTDVSDYVNPKDMVANKNDPEFKEKVANNGWQNTSLSKIHDKEFEKLPEELRGLPSGHMGSHQLLVNDFCNAVYYDKIPVLNAWFAARTTIPGLVAIESSNKGGIPLEVPDCGDAPLK